MPNRKNRPSAAQLQRLRGFARDLAAAAGERIRDRQRRGGITRNRKGVGDFVTAVDVATERSLRRDIAAACGQLRHESAGA